jgi:hypothetical protein
VQRAISGTLALLLLRLGVDRSTLVLYKTISVASNLSR